MEMERSSSKFKKLLYFRRELAKTEKQKLPIFLQKVIQHFGMSTDKTLKEKTSYFPELLLMTS